MHIIFIKNCTENKIPYKYIDKSSWFIDTTFYQDITNNISYTRLNNLGEDFMDSDHILGFDIEKNIYLKKNKNTIIKILHSQERFINFENKIFKNNEFHQIKHYFNLLEDIYIYDYIVFE